MQTLFDLDLTYPPFTVQFIRDMIEVSIIDSSHSKQSIVCENIDFTVETVKYFDETGKRL